LTEEQGKPLALAGYEVGGSVAMIRAFVAMDLPVKILRENDSERIVQQHAPLGVVAAITPWNFPLMLLMMKVAPALLAGNTVVAKPAATTPLTTLLFGELCARLLPAGVLNVIADQNDLGGLLSQHPDVAKVAFTGSTATGRKVMASVANTIKRLTLELGGNDAAIVLDDANVKEVALKYGWHATFMPKPMFGQNGSGMHTHQSLFADGKNAFYDANDQYFLSDVGKAFIAGQLKHAREICSIFAQWVNSYKRLVPGFEAPVYVAWSRRNRSALVRVPMYHPGREQATRMELRCPDPACNPYLTFAALLQAGLEGIEKGYELPEPMEKNLYHLSGEERKRLGVEQLPESLGEAIELTTESELVLRTLGEHMFNRYVEIKRQEWEDYRVNVTQWELDRYLSIL